MYVNDEMNNSFPGCCANPTSIFSSAKLHTMTVCTRKTKIWRTHFFPNSFESRVLVNLCIHIVKRFLTKPISSILLFKTIIRDIDNFIFRLATTLFTIINMNKFIFMSTDIKTRIKTDLLVGN